MIRSKITKVLLTFALVLALVIPTSQQPAEAATVQTFYPLSAPVELTPTVNGAWVDVDVSSYVPAGASGVIIHCVNTSASATRGVGLREKGSDDNRTETMGKESHFWAMVGVDDDVVFQIYQANSGDNDFYLVGYTGGGVVYLDTAVNVSPTEADTWETKDVSASCPDAIAAIVELVQIGGGAGIYAGYLRKNGSTDVMGGFVIEHNWMLVAVDDDQKFQAMVSHLNVDMYVTGYITYGAVFNTNLVEKAPSIDDWQDVGCGTECPSADMIFFWAAGTAGGTDGFYGARNNGSSENIFGRPSHYGLAIVDCDANQIVELKRDSSWPKHYIIGYSTAPTPVTNLLATPLSGTEIALSWTAGEGGTTGLYVKSGSYPSYRGDGTLVYQGTSESVTNTGLTPGTVYYYRAWDYDPTEEDWSLAYDQDIAVTMVGTPGVEAPTMPSEWFQTPECTAYDDLPFYDAIVNISTEYEIPLATMCVLVTLTWISTLGAAVFAMVRSAPIPIATMAVAITICSIAHLLPMWMLAISLSLGGLSVFLRNKL